MHLTIAYLLETVYSIMNGSSFIVFFLNLDGFPELFPVYEMESLFR